MTCKIFPEVVGFVFVSVVGSQSFIKFSGHNAEPFVGCSSTAKTMAMDLLAVTPTDLASEVRLWNFAKLAFFKTNSLLQPYRVCLVLSSITFPGQCNRWVRKAEPEKAQISARNAVECQCSVQIGDKPDLQSPPRPRSAPPLPSLASLSSLKMRDRQNRDTWCIWT